MSSQQRPLPLLCCCLLLSLFPLATDANLCALCQSLRDHVSDEFHSCVIRDEVIRHCNDKVDTHVAALKIVGFQRIVRVNYGGSPPSLDRDAYPMFEIGVNVITDVVVGDGGHHHSSSSSSSQILQTSHHGNQSSPRHNQGSGGQSQGTPQTPSSAQIPVQLPPPSLHHVQTAVLRFSRYPSSLLMHNPCRHVLGTSNSVFAKRMRAGGVLNNGQRISTFYFAIDDKSCRGPRARGKRKKCIASSQSWSRPYECCSWPPRDSDQRCANDSLLAHSPHSSHTPDSHYPPDPIARPLILSIQCVCICFTLVLSLLVFYFRKTKVIQVSVWPLTESIVFGSLLLYVTVAIRASYDFDTPGAQDTPWWAHTSSSSHGDVPPRDKNSTWACVAEPWAREIGFTLVYGGIVLKIYRSLVEFRTRKAHRWVVREKDILRYLGTTIAVVLFYLLAWTCTIRYVGNVEQHVEGGEGHVVCPAITAWHRVTEIGELLYITVGLNMAWHLRTSPVSPFLERQMYTAALVVEAVTSVLLIVVRESKLMFFTEYPPSGSHDQVLIEEAGAGAEDDDENSTFLLLVYFVRCHVATSIVLGLVFGPKLYYVYVDSSTRKRAQLRRGDTLTGTGSTGGVGQGGGGGGSVTAASLTNLKAGQVGLVGGVDHTTLIDLDFAEVSLADMDPQDIKSELKRVYTQLELLRNKTMRKDNPHISKRRGGRKPTHRRFSLQKKGSRDKTAAAAAAMRSRLQAQQQQSQTDSYTNKYRYDDIEDSVCSIEGPSTYSEVGGYR